MLLSASGVGTLSCGSSSVQGRSVSRSPNFTVYDALIYGDKPNIGIKPILVTGKGYWKGNDNSKPDEAACRQLARESAGKYSKVVVNIEHWPLDIRRSSKKEVQASMDKILQVLRWMRSERPKLQLGFYGSPPHRDYWGPIRANPGVIKDWQASNDFLKPIADAIDFVSPSLYTFYDDTVGWIKYAKANIAEAKRFGKPVLPFIWPRYHVSNRLLRLKYIPGDYWMIQLRTIQDSGVEGVILWDWFGFGDRSKPALDPTQDWWKETAKFMR
jgi:hypothetical protein